MQIDNIAPPPRLPSPGARQFYTDLGHAGRPLPPFVRRVPPYPTRTLPLALFRPVPDFQLFARDESIEQLPGEIERILECNEGIFTEGRLDAFIAEPADLDRTPILSDRILERNAKPHGQEDFRSVGPKGCERSLRHYRPQRNRC